MATMETNNSGTFISILSSDASFRKPSTKEDSGSVLREYETSDGKKGEKWEIPFHVLKGTINNIWFKEGDYGKQLLIAFDEDEGGESLVLALNVATPFAEDLMKKLPNVDLTKPVRLQPFSFEDDNGKTRKGITVKQGNEFDTKIENYFFDQDNKKPTNGLPEPEGDPKSFDNDDWKMYFTKVRKFLITYTQENICTKFDNKMSDIRSSDNYPTADDEKIDPNDIPF